MFLGSIDSNGLTKFITDTQWSQGVERGRLPLLAYCISKQIVYIFNSLPPPNGMFGWRKRKGEKFFVVGGCGCCSGGGGGSVVVVVVVWSVSLSGSGCSIGSFFFFSFYCF